MNIPEDSKCKFLHILEQLNAKAANTFTIKELSFHLKVSERTMIDFKKGRIFNFWLLDSYAGILGEELIFLLV